MARHKKINDVHSVEEPIKEVLPMTDTQVLEETYTELDQVRAELEAARLDLEEKKRQIKEEEASVNKMRGRKLDDDEKIIHDKHVNNMSQRTSAASKIEQQRQIDSVMVTGKFINRRAPGSAAKLTYCKYKEDVPKWTTFEDGKVYTIQRGFADQINEHYHKPAFIQKAGEMDGNRPESAIQEVDTSNKLYSFVPINF